MLIADRKPGTTRRTAMLVIGEITISADGYSAGLNQTEERPFGDDGGDGWGDRLHAWFVEAPDENRAEIDQLGAYAAVILARILFCPVRRVLDRLGKGGGGDNPPSHGPVFVLTHHAREPRPMEG